MNAQTEKILNSTTLLLHFVKGHPDCDIEALAKNHLEVLKEEGLYFIPTPSSWTSTSKLIPIDLEEKEYAENSY